MSENREDRGEDAPKDLFRHPLNSFLESQECTIDAGHGIGFGLIIRSHLSLDIALHRLCLGFRSVGEEKMGRGERTWKVGFFVGLWLADDLPLWEGGGLLRRR